MYTLTSGEIFKRNIFPHHTLLYSNIYCDSSGKNSCL